MDRPAAADAAKLGADAAKPAAGWEAVMPLPSGLAGRAAVP
ncbi:hypothetical protein AEGHOMDF_3955 [Methylobacterium soli]|nr:hypothetical protein AEGHOMDF_3955 [Methylobacterium soli]